MRILFFIVIVCLITECASWDADDLALFDVFEDVGQNFYELIGVEQAATSTDIRRAYRRLSLQLHPDKNKDPDAENQFRKLVSAYEILKDEKMRTKYNELLVTGLPDWRQPVYYYRKVKKMGLVESSILLAIIITVGHFLVSWSIYLEKIFVYEELNKSKRKKDKKSRKQKSDDPEPDSNLSNEAEQLIQKPKLSDLLPILMIKGCYWLVVSSPDLLMRCIESVKSSKEEEPEEDDSVQSAKPRTSQRTPASNFTYELAEPTKVTSPGQRSDNDLTNNEDACKTESQKSSEWMEAEIEMLVKAIVRFPGGTAERWEKISVMVGRSVKEVINMSKQLKTTNTPASEMNAKIQTKRTNDDALQNVELTTSELECHVTSSTQKDTSPIITPIITPITTTNPTKNNRNVERTLMISKVTPQVKVAPAPVSTATTWTQQQQKLLEGAMTQIPKDDPDRWQKVADLVPGKSKEECLQRVRHLAEVVKKRKLNQQQNETKSDD